MSKEIKITKTICLPLSIWEELDKMADNTATSRSSLIFFAIIKKYEGKRINKSWKLKSLSIKSEINSI